VVYKRPQFLLDFAEELSYLNERAGAEVAERWQEALASTIRDLEANPFIGRARADLRPAGIRSWRMRKFPRWLLFYIVKEDGSLVLLRVRYATMNFRRMPMTS
jgi:plasmid stabilization system protein ParE